MALIVQSSFYGLKYEILLRLVLKFLQTFKGSFRAQMMPITRSKQLVVVQEFPSGDFKYCPYDVGVVRLSVSQLSRGSTSCLDPVRGKV